MGAVERRDEHGTDAIDQRGFEAVDDQPDPSVLVETMEITSQWASVLRLRAWEREHLAVGVGDSLLDVGCGLGDVARAYAELVGPAGRIVGIDASEEMLAIARERAARDGVEVTFRVADALAIDEPDAAFDACRSERVLQWLPDMEAAIREMLRVLRPGGRVCLTDSDWRTFVVDLPDRALSARIADAVVAFRGDGAATGGRLLNVCRDVGLTDLAHSASTHVWDAWDPDRRPGPPGLFPLRDVFSLLVAAGHIDDAEAERFFDQIEAAARADRLFMSVSMTAVYGRAP